MENKYKIKYIQNKYKYKLENGNNQIGGVNIKHNVIDKYYLCTQCRHESGIDIILPFGSFIELDTIYREYNYDLSNIKSQKIDISSARIVGTSQYGSYFRLIEKSQIDNIYIKHNDDNTNFETTRSFIFDFGIFLEYVFNLTNNIPLFFYSPGNNYGYQKYGSVLLSKKYDTIINFLNNIENLIQTNFEHELVCRIPIPLDSKTGFIGKINVGTLGMKNTKERLIYQKILDDRQRQQDDDEKIFYKKLLDDQQRQQDDDEKIFYKKLLDDEKIYQKQLYDEKEMYQKNLDDEKNRCNIFNDNNECIKQKCWYDTYNQKCKPMFSFITKENIK